MSILIQAGHYSSYSDFLMKKMYERGLGKPIESYTHKLTSQQVTDTIHKILSRTDTSVANNKLADNIMVDFLLSNLDTENWGWADEKNLLALDYWQQLEPDVRFILVFDHPNQLLAQIADRKLTQDIVDRTINDWLDYHNKMLDIIEAYGDKAILIEGICALDNISNLGEKMKMLANSLQLKSKWQIPHDASNQVVGSNTITVKQTNMIAEHINNEILKKYPEVIKLFNTLLSKAVLKSSEPIYKTKPTELHSLITVLNNIQEQQHNENYLVENQKLSQQINEIQKEYNIEVQNLRLKCQESTEENISVLKQLHRIQEELEKKVIENRNYRKSSKDNSELLTRKIEELNTFKQESEKREIAGQRIADQYESKLEEIQKRHNQLQPMSKEDDLTVELKQENERLLKQLHYTQEELEKYYLKNESPNHSNKLTQTLQVKNSIQPSANIPVYYGAAERIKNDLPYRLGSKMIKATKPKDLMFLPLTLAKEYRDFQKFGKSQVNLPDLQEYQDRANAEKVREHLSYQLGSMLLESSKSPKATLILPLNMGKRIIEFKKGLKKK